MSGPERLSKWHSAAVRAVLIHLELQGDSSPAAVPEHTPADVGLLSMVMVCTNSCSCHAMQAL